MKAVILAGGRGTRLAEITQVLPKPMVEIGERPILWHIMKRYAAFGISEFIILVGYKGEVIKRWFVDYRLHCSDITVDLASGRVTMHQTLAEPWLVTLIDTGIETQTGGRLRRVRHLLQDEDAFCFTYGDGVADVDIRDLIAFHHTHGKLATVTAVSPPGRFGALRRDGTQVRDFVEKPDRDGASINAGFFVLSPRVIERIDGDATQWELAPLRSLAADGELVAYDHFGFWQPMDTLRERDYLERLWASGNAPWKSW